MPADPALLIAAILAVAPRADATTWATALAPVMRSSGITTPNRIAMAVAMFGEETGFEMRSTPLGPRLIEENLHYTVAAICRVWPNRYSSLASVPASIVMNPENLANTVYAGREGNGDFASGDGWRFRGRGLIQLTFRTAYEHFAAAMKRPLDDGFLDWCSTPAGASASACWYWLQPCRPPSLLALSDTGDVEGVTSRVNGGDGNLATRERLFGLARAALSSASAQTPAPPVESEADRLDDEFNPAPAGSPATTET